MAEQKMCHYMSNNNLLELGNLYKKSLFVKKLPFKSFLRCVAKTTYLDSLVTTKIMSLFEKKYITPKPVLD